MSIPFEQRRSKLQDLLAGDPALMQIEAAMLFSGLSRSALYRALAAGKIMARKAGRSTLIETASLRDFIAALPAATFRGAGGQAP
jgi:hypothetical protein